MSSSRGFAAGTVSCRSTAAVAEGRGPAAAEGGVCGSPHAAAACAAAADASTRCCLLLRGRLGSAGGAMGRPCKCGTQEDASVLIYSQAVLLVERRTDTPSIKLQLSLPLEEHSVL